MTHDPYEILGVAQDSGPAEWKRAYRRLAMRWHPDRNDHPDATERFKQINAAYERITAVDVPEMAKTEAEESSEAAAEPEETVARAADIRLNLEVGLEEAAAGCRKTVHYARSKACPTCEGSGEHGMSRTRFCQNCHGSGRVHDAGRKLVHCPDCGGRGFHTERTCKECGGSGREITEVSLKITVPPGMLPGDELRLAGQGEQGDETHQAGHLFLTLVIRSHPLYQLRGRDLHLRMPVSALALIAGAEIEIPGLSGPIKHTLDQGAAVERELRLAGQGYPGRGKVAAGDLIVALYPVFPSRLNAKQRKLMLQANAALLGEESDALPEIGQWRAEMGLSG